MTSTSQPNILIIGATSAIAEAVARIFAGKQARMFLVARDDVKLQTIAADLRIRGAVDVQTYHLDVHHTDQYAAMLQQAWQALSRVDLALIAHGTLSDQNHCEQEVSYLINEFQTNALSVIALASLLAEKFARQKSGTLAVISSVAGDRGRAANYAYGSAKAAVSCFLQGLRARMLRERVQVLTIKPGFVDTPMTKHLPLPPQLLATPERVANDIVQAIERRCSVLYTPWFWRWIMLLIKLIPEPIFIRLKL